VGSSKIGLWGTKGLAAAVRRLLRGFGYGAYFPLALAPTQ
jgi:hypothetical protein